MKSGNGKCCWREMKMEIYSRWQHSLGALKDVQLRRWRELTKANPCVYAWKNESPLKGTMFLQNFNLPDNLFTPQTANQADKITLSFSHKHARTHNCRLSHTSTRNASMNRHLCDTAALTQNVDTTSIIRKLWRKLTWKSCSGYCRFKGIICHF